MKHTLSVSPSFSECLPEFRMAMIEAEVVNSPFDPALQTAIDVTIGDIVLNCPLQQVKQIPAIFHTRRAYKILGKDPNRYRPAAEQLRRRIINGLGLYRINALVDFGNLLSLQSGYSIGVFDATLVGSDILLRRGTPEDRFEGIGRGILNVEGLPLYEDAEGPFATPTSDSERTKVRPSTSETLIFINSYLPEAFHAEEQLHAIVDDAVTGLRNFLKARNTEVAYFGS